MERRIFTSVMAFIAACSMFLTTGYAATVITPATGGTCLNITPGAYKVLSNITITEGVATDFGIQAGATFILTAPAGTEFRPGTGSVVFTAGRDITSASMVVTSTTITVTLNIPTNSNLDMFRIRNIEARSLLAYATGNILRTIAGGTAVVNGDAPGGGVNHGTLTTTGTGAIFTSVSNGNWSSGSTWSGGIAPSCNDNVVINNTVTTDLPVGISNLTINTGGNLISTNAVTVSGTFDMAGTGIYTHSNNTAASTTIFNGTENFAATSKIIINNWSSYTIPFPTGVTGDFGAIEFNTTGAWNQSGMFAPARIKGTLTINSGSITMDNGTGMTTALTLQDVMITGTGRIIVQSGTPRDLTLATGNYTDNSAATGYSYIVFRSVGNFVWNVNGNMNVSHRFMMMEGLVATDVGSATINVTGNLQLGGGTIFGMRNVTGPFSMSVTGTSTITGTPALISFKENFTGNLTFTSGNMTVDSGTGNYFMRGTTCSGTVTVIINGDMNILGNTTRLYIASTSTNPADLTLTVTDDLNVTGSQLYTAASLGNVAVNVGGYYTQTGVTSTFFGQRTATSTGNVTIFVNGSLSISNGLFYVSQGRGTIDLDVVETLSVQNCSFFGMNNTTAGNFGAASLDVTDLDISGSTFYLHRGEITDGRSIDVNISDQMLLNFTSPSQVVFFVGRASNNNAVLNLNIGTNFFATGSANGLFCSSMSEGVENVTIGGDLSVGAGRIRFNSYEDVNARGHNVNGTITGSLLISGGSISLSSNRYAANWDIAGDYEQTGGYAIYKWHTGASTINVQGNYTLSNGSVHFYARSANGTPDQVSLTVNGDASFENSTMVFDSSTASTATHRMVLKGSNVTFGSNVMFTHISHLTSGIVFGNIVYDRVGTINVMRNTSSYDIRQVKQNITNGTTVNFTASPFDFMVASHESAVATTHTTLTVDGTLDMGTRMIAARDQVNYFSSVTVSNTGRIRTAHTNGFYAGAFTPSCVYPVISSSLRMNYFLAPNSTIEYNGTDTQIVTGTGLGLATTTDHRYGNLEINFQGTADAEFVYPFDNNVYIRTGLILTTGELNLDMDHNTTTGGRELKVLNGATISRTNGYLRSETDDGTGALNWNITTNGSFVIPFGYNSTEYIPFTYQPTAGSSGDVVIATNHVAPDNTPYPPTVTHVRDLAGADNSNNTVDRFWRISVPGSVTATLTFSSTNLERTGLVNPRAQLWEPVTMGWYPPSGIQSNPTASTTMASGITGLNNWWTLSSLNTPLPIELISFEASPENNKIVRLTWSTATEINNDYFTVERSANGENFIALFNIPGAGNSTTEINYKAYDNTPLNGISYYRLKQTDFDGTASWSTIRVVTLHRDAPVTVYPNPLIGTSVSVSTENENERITSIVVYDVTGKVISNIDGIVNGDNRTTAEIELGNDLDQGVYLMEVNTSTGIHRERIIKQ